MQINVALHDEQLKASTQLLSAEITSAFPTFLGSIMYKQCHATQVVAQPCLGTEIEVKQKLAMQLLRGDCCSLVNCVGTCTSSSRHTG